MTMSSHVQTHVHAPAQLDNKKLDIYFSKIIIDTFPASRGVKGGKVSDEDFVFIDEIINEKSYKDEYKIYISNHKNMEVWRL